MPNQKPSFSKTFKKKFRAKDTNILRVFNILQEANLDVCIKGAFLLNIVIKGESIPFIRATNDIDCDIDLAVESTDELEDYLVSKIKAVAPGIILHRFRKNAVEDGKSGGFFVVEGEDIPANTLCLIDLHLGSNAYKVLYPSPKNSTFYGQSLAKIISDKIYVASTFNLIVRYKDLYDIFLLSKFRGWSILEIKKILIACEKSLKDFTCFSENINELYEAHEQFGGNRKGKKFVDVYSRAQIFLDPFINGMNTSDDLIWNGENWVNCDEYEGTYMLAYENFAQERTAQNSILLFNNGRNVSNHSISISNLKL